MDEYGDEISQEIIDYLQQPSDIIQIFVDNEVDKAKAAKKGKLLCIRDKCPNYLRRDNDGYGYRDCGCRLSDNGKYLIEHKICPYKEVKPFRYNPFKKYSDIKPKGISIIVDGTDMTAELSPIGSRFKEAVDEVYKDWED